MPKDRSDNITAAMSRIPCGLFILTAAHDNLRSGVLTRWVQPCALEPPMVMVSVSKGLPIEPLLRDSRRFALCQLSAGDRLLEQRFRTPPDRSDDPFVTLAHHSSTSGLPIIDRAMSWLECEIVRHVDLDADQRLYVGHVHGGGILHAEQEPAIELGTTNGRL